MAGDSDESDKRVARKTEKGKEYAIQLTSNKLRNGIKMAKRTMAAIGGELYAVDTISTSERRNLWGEAATVGLDALRTLFTSVAKDLETSKAQNFEDEIKEIERAVTGVNQAIDSKPIDDSTVIVSDDESENESVGETAEASSTAGPGQEVKATATLEALIRSLETSRVPYTEPDVFSGETLKYFLWESQVNLIIDKKPLRGAEKNDAPPEVCVW